MPLDPILGLGRDPRVAGTPVTVSISDSSFDLVAGASPASNTNSATIPSQVQIYAISVGLIQQTRDQTSTNARLRITIYNKLIVDYLLPTFNAAATPSEWAINELIPFNYLNIGETPLVATLSADNGGTTGYIIEVRINALGVEV
jgi:hypothetical protein